MKFHRKLQIVQSKFLNIKFNVFGAFFFYEKRVPFFSSQIKIKLNKQKIISFCIKNLFNFCLIYFGVENCKFFKVNSWI